MSYWFLFAALAGLAVGWLMLDGPISGVLLGAGLGATVYFYERRKAPPQREEERR